MPDTVKALHHSLCVSFVLSALAYVLKLCPKDLKMNKKAVSKYQCTS